MICPRCDSDKARVLVNAPVDEAWTVYICDKCDFSWRNTESEEITNPAKYSRKWKLNDEKIAGMMHIPPIPPLKTK